jgi:hypothetical protein
MKKPDPSSNEEIINKGNEIILLNAYKTINLKENNIYVESNEIDNSGK